MKLWFICLVLLLSAARWDVAALPALSADFEKYMLAHHYAAVRVESGGPNAESVRAQINGQSVVMMVDTGTPRSSISYACARRLGLDVHDTGEDFWGVGGFVKGKYGIALINSFKFPFGDINRTNTILVLPKSAAIDWGIDGFFGADFLSLNAAVLPIGGHGILLKPGPSPAVSIADYMAKMNFKPVPLRGEGGHIWVDAHLSGQPLKLMVDSGAGLTNLRAASVKAALHQAELDSTQKLSLYGLDGKRETSFYVTPNQLDLGDFDVSHQTLMVTEAALFDQFHFDGLAGVDLLGRHDAIVDFGGGVLWLR